MSLDTPTGHRSRGRSPCEPRKHPTRVMHRAGSASAAVLFAVLGTAHALPQAGQAVAGAGTVALTQGPTGPVMTVTQSTPKLVINWTSFNTVTGETVTFAQPSRSSIVLNRVLDQSQTRFLGSLNANGQVFVVNPSGILFGVGSQVTVGGLVASSRSISDTDFLAGLYRFGGTDVSNPVVNYGHISAKDGGYVALIGPIVQNGIPTAEGGTAQNRGTIVTPHGTALLAGADQVTLQLNGSSLLGYTIDRGAVNAVTENAQFGTITADGGKVILTSKAVNALAPAVVNNYGIIEATTIVEAGGGQSGGVIQLLGDMAAGQVNQNGKLDASALNGGNGGIIEVSAKTVTVANTAVVTTEALPLQGTSGKVLVTANNFRIDRYDRDSANIRRGDMSSTQLQDELEHSSSVTIATSTPGDTRTGDITVAWPIGWSTGSTLNLSSERNIVIDAGIQGAGNLMLRADSTGTGVGDIFITPALANFMPNGRADLYYNPSDATKNIANFFTGSVTSYWLINDLAHLQAMNGNLAGNYALGRDIDASDSNNTVFLPVGSTNGGAFTGKFDGLNHVISSLKVSSSDFSVGLFGFIDQATISNVGLAGGSTTASRSWAGGLAGLSTRSSISNAFNTGTVEGNSGAGGLVGIASQTTVRDAYASGTVASAFGPAGGLVASIDGGAISGSYSSGAVSGPISSGLVGRFDPAATTTQSNYWYSVTPVAGSNRAGVTKLDTVAQLNTPNSFAGFDFNTTWRQYDGFGAPLLKSFLKPLTITLSDTTRTYDGLAGAPVQITFSDPAATANGTGLVFQPLPQGIRNAGLFANSPNAWSKQVNGFDISYAGGKTSATVEVQKAPLIIAATGATKTYEGTTSSAAKPTVTGLQPGDTANAIESYDSRNAGARTLTASLASISDGNGGNNYAVQYVGADGTILRAPLAVTAVSDTKAFDGTTTSSKSPLVTGLMPGDSLSRNVETFDAAATGTRVLTATTLVNDGNGGANYVIGAGAAAGQIVGGKTVLEGLQAGLQNASAVAVEAALLTDPGSRLAAARTNALVGVGATNPTNVLAQFNDEALYAADSVQARWSAQSGRTGRHSFNVEGSGIRLPEGVE
ncbi:MAG: filamentous hemagglutinin N-terminal protein [Herminiimonas sp.]|nr:filamentous hemagglutinin N-terminal protein [Herminiimonas sp.]